MNPSGTDHDDSLLYGVDESPRNRFEILLYAWQHTLVDISPFVLPLAVGNALKLESVEMAEFINFVLIAMGLATLLQTTAGNRLPIVQGPSATLIGTMAPLAAHAGAALMWGAALAGGFAEMIVGCSGVLRFMRRLFSPSVTAAVIVSIGLILGQLALRLAIGDGSPTAIAFSAGTLACIGVLRALFRQRGPRLLSAGAVFFSIWIVGLGAGHVTGQVRWALVESKPWLQFPGLFPFGMPFEGPLPGWPMIAGALAVIMAGYLGSVLESAGDYAATASVARTRLTEAHLNRGICCEGAGSVLATLIGGLPCTSYSQNIGIIAATRVASRRVVQIAGLVLLAYGLCPKFGALLVALPRSSLGGVLLVVCAMIVLSGWRLLEGSGNARREWPWLALTAILSLAVPALAGAPARELLDQGRFPTIFILLSNGVVVAVVAAVSIRLLRSRRAAD